MHARVTYRILPDGHRRDAKIGLDLERAVPAEALRCAKSGGRCGAAVVLKDATPIQSVSAIRRVHERLRCALTLDIREGVADMRRRVAN